MRFRLHQNTCDDAIDSNRFPTPCRSLQLINAAFLIDPQFEPSLKYLDLKVLLIVYLDDLVCASTISLKDTVLIALLGTSIPISDLPGIGASIRTSLAASAKAMSSVKLTILLTFTPNSGLNFKFCDRWS